MDLNNLINKIDIKQERENKALDAYAENYDKNREKLETLLSKFNGIINDNAAPELLDYEGANDYYNYVYKKINNLDFDIESVNLLTGNLYLYEIIRNDYKKNAKSGLLLSALINKNVKAGEKVQIKALMPIDYLSYKLENAEAYVNKAGDYFGTAAKNSKIYVYEAGAYAGKDMENCELHVKKADHFLGNDAKNSKIYVYEAGKLTGCNMENCELHVKKAGDYLGDNAKNSRIYADEAGNFPGWAMRECELHVKKAGEYLGDRAINSKIYADEAETNAGKDMENSELFIYKLEGKLYKGYLEGKNKIYLGRESYYKHHLKYRLTGVKVWEKKT